MNKEIYQIPNAKLKTGEIPVGILTLNPKDGKGRILVGNKEDIQNNTATAKEFSLTPVQLSLIRILDEDTGVEYETIANKYLDAPAHNLAMTLASTEMARNSVKRSDEDKQKIRIKTQEKIDALCEGETQPMIGIKTNQLPSIATVRMQIWHLRQKLGAEAITSFDDVTYRLTKMSEIPELLTPQPIIESQPPFVQKLISNLKSFLPHSHKRS